jgi:hypothetical protein
MADEPMRDAKQEAEQEIEQDAGLTEEWDHPGRYAGMAQESEIGPRPGSLEAVAIMHQFLENQEREAQWEMQQAVENRRHGEEVAVPIELSGRESRLAADARQEAQQFAHLTQALVTEVRSAAQDGPAAVSKALTKLQAKIAELKAVGQWQAPQAMAQEDHGYGRGRTMSLDQERHRGYGRE